MKTLPPIPEAELNAAWWQTAEADGVVTISGLARVLRTSPLRVARALERAGYLDLIPRQGREEGCE